MEQKEENSLFQPKSYAQCVCWLSPPPRWFENLCFFHLRGAPTLRFRIPSGYLVVGEKQPLQPAHGTLGIICAIYKKQSNNISGKALALYISDPGAILSTVNGLKKSLQEWYLRLSIRSGGPDNHFTVKLSPLQEQILQVVIYHSGTHFSFILLGALLHHCLCEA